MPEMTVKSAKPQKGGTDKKNPASSKSRQDLSQSLETPVKQILYLQQTAGNRAVNRLIQAKFKVGPPNDIYEKEADRVADKVMKMPESSLVQRESTCPECEEKEKEEGGIQTKSLSRQITPWIQRKTLKTDDEDVNAKLMDTNRLQREEVEEEKEKQPFFQKKEESQEEDKKETPVLAKLATGSTPSVSPGTESGINSLKGGGQPLSGSTRAFFEPRLGVDFSQVRVHTDTRAAQAAQSINAKAFTTGRDIVFGSGQYSPGTSSGKHLLAHELTHVAQQNSNELRPSASPTQKHPVMDSVTAACNRPGIIRRRGPSLLERGLSFIGGSAPVQAIINRVAPGLISILRQGIGPRIMGLLCRGVDRFVAATLGRLMRINFASGLENRFRTANQNVRNFIGGIQGGISSRLGEMLRPLVNSLDRNGIPFLRRLQRTMSSISRAFSTVWRMIARPAASFLSGVGGAIWGGITRLASWLWNLTSPVRRLASSAWNWIKTTFNIAWNSRGGARNWIVEKATETWNRLKSTLRPVIGPLRVVGGFLIRFSPLGPVIALMRAIRPLWGKLRWLWNNWNTDDILVRARNILREQILPGVIDGVASVSSIMASAAGWLVTMTARLNRTFGGLLGAIGVSRCLRSVTRIMSFVSNQFRRLAAWARTGFAGLMNLIRSGLRLFVTILRPILEFLVQLTLTIANPFRIPALIGGALWRLIPDNLKPKIANFIFELLLTFIRPLPLFAAGLGPLGSVIKNAIIGFLVRMRKASDEEKIVASNRIAMLLGTGSLEFIAGLLRGILRGIWEGITDPFKLIYMLGQVVVRVSRYLYNRIQSLLRGIRPGGNENRDQTTNQQPVGDTVVAAVQEAVTMSAGVDQEWKTGQDEASSGKNANKQGLFALLSSAWSRILSAVGQIGGRMAEALLNFLRLPDFQLGDKIGWVGGTVIFEVALYILTAGAWAGVTAARPVLRAILRLLDLGGEILGGLIRLLGSIRRPLMSALGSIGTFLRRMPVLRSVIDKITAALRAIFRYGDEAAAARRGTREGAEEAGTRTGREAMEEAGERTGREAGEEAGERGARNEALKAAQYPEALAAARLIAETNDRANTPIPWLIVQLNALKRRYRWIDAFQARPKGIPGHYRILMIASENEVDRDYSTLPPGELDQLVDSILPYPNLGKVTSLRNRIKRILRTNNVNPDILREIISKIHTNRAGVRRISIYIEEMATRNIEGMGRVLADMAVGGNKLIGAEWVLRYINSRKLWDSVVRFEALEETIGLGRRCYDAIIGGVRVQFKSWGRFIPDTFLEQIRKDYHNLRGNLSALKWVFEERGFSGKSDVIERMTITLRGAIMRREIRHVTGERIIQALPRIVIVRKVIRN
jgi:hypothetical protein